MPIDPAIENLLGGELVAGARNGGALTSAMDRNLVQGLGVVNTTLIQQHGGVADDAAIMAALQTANQVPGAGRATP